MDFEVADEKLGGCGLYHYFTFFLLSVVTFKQAVNLQGMTFAIYAPLHQCDEGLSTFINKTYFNNSMFTPQYSADHCSYRISNNHSWTPCTRWKYNTDEMHSTMVSDYNWVCGKAGLGDYILMTYFIGGLFCFPINIAADKFGKRWILIVSLFASVCITFVQVVVNPFWFHLATTFLVGLINSIYVQLGLSTLAELTPEKKIGITIVSYWAFFSIGYMSTAGFAYWFRSWRLIYLGSLTFCVFYLFYFCFIPETPRWLLLNGQKDRAFKTMRFIARINGCTLKKEDFDQWKPVQQTTGKLQDLFRYKRMIGRLCILTFTAFVFSFAYMGTSTDLKFASENIFLTTLFMGIAEIPTSPLAAVTAAKLGRRRATIILCGIGALCLFLLPFLEINSKKSTWQPWIKLVLATIGKIGFSSAWSVFDLTTNELIPTTNRNAGTTIVYTVVGIGAVVAPRLHDMALKTHHALPCFVYSALIIIVMILEFIFIPETSNIPLPQTAEEASKLVRGNEQDWKIAMAYDSKRRGTILSHTDL